ncbi:MAG: DUF294 nucleotidyltransferase-like domain-containing protein, partial [Terrimicrobiaceae bacterium]
MSLHTELQALEASAVELSRKALSERGSPIQLFKDFLQVEEERLREWHRSGGGGREIARQRADTVDILLRELFSGIVREVATAPLTGRLCVTAFGGYGRRELTPMSDIDILFLQDRSTRDKEAEEIIRRTIVALWDIGFKVGQATRTISEAIQKSNEDMVTKTSMLESRFLAGDREIFTRFKDRFQRECIQGREQEYIGWRLTNQAEMRLKYGQSVFMQEPNIKNGTGSLRD